MADVITLPIEVDATKAKAELRGLTANVIGLNQAFELAAKAGRLLENAFKSTVSRAIDLQAQVAEISTLLGDQTDATGKLTNEILSLQATFGTSQQELAKGYYNAISSGAVDATNAINLMATANKLAVGGVTTLDVAIDGLTNVINAYGLKAEDAVSVSDALFIGMKAGKTTVAELSGSLGKVASFANVTGVSFQELIAATSAITTGGVSTAEAVTQVRGALVALSRQTPDLTKILKNLNIESIQTAVSQEGLVNVLKKIIGQTDGTTEEMSKLFGSIEAVNAVVSLTSDSIGSKFNSIMADMGQAAGDNGKVTEEAFKKISETAAYQLKVLGGELEATFTVIGAKILPYVVSFAKSFSTVLGDVINVVLSFEKSLNAVDFSKFIYSLTALSSALILFNSQAIIGGVIKLAKAFTLAAAGPIAMGAAIAGTVVAIDLVITNIKNLSNITKATFTFLAATIKKKFLEIITSVNEGFLTLQIGAEKFGLSTKAGIKATTDEINKFKEAISEADIAINESKDGFDDAVNSLTTKGSLIDSVYTEGKKFVDTFNESLSKTNTIVNKLDFSKIPDKKTVEIDVKQNFEADFNGIQAKFEEFADSAEQFLNQSKKNFEKNSGDFYKGAAIAFKDALVAGTKETRSILNEKKKIDKELAQAKADGELEKYQELLEKKKELDEDLQKTQQEKAGEVVAKTGGLFAEAIMPGAGQFVEAFLQLAQDPEAFETFVVGFAEAIPDIVAVIITNIPAIAAALVKAIVVLIESAFDNFATAILVFIEDTLGPKFLGAILNGASQFIARLIEEIKKGVQIKIELGETDKKGLPTIGGEAGKIGNAVKRIYTASNGLVVPSGFPNDTFGPVMVESGEEVVSSADRSKIKDDIAMLSSLIASQNQSIGREPIQVNLLLDNRVLSSTILNLSRNNGRLVG